MDQTHPLTYIQDIIMREVHKHQRNPVHQTFLMGDLSSSWTNTDKGAPTQPYSTGQIGWGGTILAVCWPPLTQT